MADVELLLELHRAGVAAERTAPATARYDAVAGLRRVRDAIFPILDENPVSSLIRIGTPPVLRIRWGYSMAEIPLDLLT
jgi:hypothetical protein